MSALEQLPEVQLMVARIKSTYAELMRLYPTATSWENFQYAKIANNAYIVAAHEAIDLQAQRARLARQRGLENENRARQGGMPGAVLEVHTTPA